MNTHFEDARYHLKRAGKHARKGAVEEFEPLEAKIRELTGRQKDPEPGRIEKLRAELSGLEERAAGEARNAVETTREKLRKYRNAGEAGAA